MTQQTQKLRERIARRLYYFAVGCWPSTAWQGTDSHKEYLAKANQVLQDGKEAGLKFVTWYDAEFKEEKGEVICEEKYKIKEIEDG